MALRGVPGSLTGLSLGGAHEPDAIIGAAPQMLRTDELNESWKVKLPSPAFWWNRGK